MLTVNNIYFSYNNNTVLKGINASVKTDDFVAVIGENGAGKSTFLKAIYGILKIDSGEIKWHNRRVLGPDKVLIPGDPSMKMVTQDAKLDINQTVFENIECRFKQKSESYITTKISTLLALTDLTELTAQKVKLISGGERQRLALACALAEMPELLILDEPFSQVDFSDTIRLLKAIKAFQKENGVTVVMVTHDTQFADLFADKIIVLENGEMNQIGTPKDIYTNPENSYTAGLTGFYFEFNNTFFRPHHVVLHNGDLEGIVKACSFISGQYLIELAYQEDTILSYSKVPLKQNTVITFSIEK